MSLLVKSILSGGACMIFGGVVSLWVGWVFFFSVYRVREIGSGFECGFDSGRTSRFPFSLRFFLMVMLFMIFDMEMVLILQIPHHQPLSMFTSKMFYGWLLLLLLMATMEEWRRGALSWKS